MTIGNIPVYSHHRNTFDRFHRRRRSISSHEKTGNKNQTIYDHVITINSLRSLGSCSSLVAMWILFPGLRRTYVFPAKLIGSNSATLSKRSYFRVTKWKQLLILLVWCYESPHARIVLYSCVKYVFMPFVHVLLFVRRNCEISIFLWWNLRYRIMCMQKTNKVESHEINDFMRETHALPHIRVRRIFRRTNQMVKKIEITIP